MKRHIFFTFTSFVITSSSHTVVHEVFCEDSDLNLAYYKKKTGWVVTFIFSLADGLCKLWLRTRPMSWQRTEQLRMPSNLSDLHFEVIGCGDYVCLFSEFLCGALFSSSWMCWHLRIVLSYQDTVIFINCQAVEAVTTAAIHSFSDMDLIYFFFCVLKCCENETQRNIWDKDNICCQTNLMCFLRFLFLSLTRSDNVPV